MTDPENEVAPCVATDAAPQKDRRLVVWDRGRVRVAAPVAPRVVRAVP